MVLLFDFIYRQFIHYPPAPTTASFKGQTIIVTGGSGGLGLATCRSLLEKGAAKVIIACRNVDKGKAAAQGLREITACSHDAVDVWPLDLGSYASVVEFSERVKSQLERLDVLVANAGMQTMRFQKVEGDEETIVTNVISTALLALLVHPKLQETAFRFNIQTHITFTGSELYEVAKFKERRDPSGQIFATLADEKKSAMGDRYNVSKLLLLLVLKRMSKISPLESSNVIVNVVAPGFCYSELHRNVGGPTWLVEGLVRALARPTEVGARTIVHGASAGPESHGQYVPDCVISPTKGLTRGSDGVDLEARVWKELQLKLEAVKPGVTKLS